VPRCLSGHSTIAPGLARPQATPLSIGQRPIRFSIARLDGAELLAELTTSILELNHEKREGLDSTFPLLQDIILAVIDPSMIQVLLTKKQLAEKHESATASIANGHLRIFCKVLALAVGLAAASSRVETIDSDGHDVVIGASMPTVDYIRAVA
jgi:hypothetical protein